MTEKILEVKHLEKTFQQKSLIPWLRPKYDILPSVDDVSFSLYKGEILGLIGESGSGKTTLGKCLIKLYEISNGNISLFGKNISQLSEKNFRPYRKDIQMIFQDLDAALNPNMRIHQILEDIIARHKKQNATQISDQINQLMLDVNLENDILHKYPAELSGGQKRRIAIAAVLSIQPKIIIADEPSTGLDSYSQSLIMQLIRDLKSSYGLSVILISHDLQLIKESCQRIAVLYLGNIVEIGSAETITQNQAHPYTKLLWNSHVSQFTQKNIAEQKHNIRSGLHDFERPHHGCRFAPRCQRYLEMNKPDICTNQKTKPSLILISSNHQVACHFNLSK